MPLEVPMCKYSVWPVGVPRFHVHGVLGIAKRWGFPGVRREEGREKNLTFVVGQDAPELRNRGRKVSKLGKF